jgi:hypothetical protein
MTPNTKPLVSLVEIDLRPILFKIQCEGETINSEPVSTEIAERVYRQFLTLRQRYPDRTLVPSALIDLVWHYHILDTRKYMVDCDQLFGSYLHHDPYFGTDEESWVANQMAWGETCKLWEQEFGEAMIGVAHRCSSKDCR